MNINTQVMSFNQFWDVNELSDIYRDKYETDTIFENCLNKIDSFYKIIWFMDISNVFYIFTNEIKHTI